MSIKVYQMMELFMKYVDQLIWNVNNFLLIYIEFKQLHKNLALLFITFETKLDQVSWKNIKVYKKNPSFGIIFKFSSKLISSNLHLFSTLYLQSLQPYFKNCFYFYNHWNVHKISKPNLPIETPNTSNAALMSLKNKYGKVKKFSLWLNGV